MYYLLYWYLCTYDNTYNRGEKSIFVHDGMSSYPYYLLKPSFKILFLYFDRVYCALIRITLNIACISVFPQSLNSLHKPLDAVYMYFLSFKHFIVVCSLTSSTTMYHIWTPYYLCKSKLLKYCL